MPPAFNLSQDQTLKFNLCCWFSSASHSFRIKEENVFVFTSNLSTQFSKFSRSLKLPESSSHQPDTHAYRFVDQFLKNSSLLFRADEFENYKTQIRLVKSFLKIFFIFFFTWLAWALAQTGSGILLEEFSTVKSLVEKIFNSTRSGLSLLAEQRVAYFNPKIGFVKTSTRKKIWGPAPPKFSLSKYRYQFNSLSSSSMPAFASMTKP